MCRFWREAISIPAMARNPCESRIVDRTLAAERWPNSTAIGQQIRPISAGKPTRLTIVGVVGNVQWNWTD
jgi:hypothetical protein